VKIMGEKGFVLVVDFPAFISERVSCGSGLFIGYLPEMVFPMFLPTPCKEKEVEICIFGTFQIQ